MSNFTEPIKISYKLIQLTNQKATVVKECFIELHKGYLRWVLDFKADEPVNKEDHNLGWEEVDNYYDIIVLKPNITGMEISFTKDKKWGVYVNAFLSEIKIYYRTKEAAQAMFDKIFEWLLNSNNNE